MLGLARREPCIVRASQVMHLCEVMAESCGRAILWQNLKEAPLTQSEDSQDLDGPLRSGLED